MDDWCIHDQHGADVNSGGGRGADDNLHPTDFEHSHQEELAQAGMVRLFYDDGDGRYFLLMMIPGASSDNALAVLTSDDDNDPQHDQDADSDADDDDYDADADDDDDDDDLRCFSCCCPRCSDPTELGAHSSTLTCRQCKV